MNTEITDWEREIDDKMHEVLAVLEEASKQDRHAVILFQALTAMMVLHFSDEYDRLEEIALREMASYVSRTTIKIPEIDKLRKILLH